MPCHSCSPEPINRGRIARCSSSSKRACKYCRIVATPWHLAPPTFPALVRPGAADRTEHVPTKNRGTNADQSAFRNIVVDAQFTTRKSLHSAPYARVEEPLHELGSTNAEWILKILARSGTAAVNGYCETLDAYPWHDCSLEFSPPGRDVRDDVPCVANATEDQ